MSYFKIEFSDSPGIQRFSNECQIVRRSVKILILIILLI